MDRAVGIMKPVDSVDVVFEERAKQLGMIEEIVLDTWWDKFKEHYDRIGFNVPLLRDSPGAADQRTAASDKFQKNRCFRIDAVVAFGKECELIEVKETGNMTAIGQLLTYQMLFLETYWGYTKLHLRLVCLRLPDPVLRCCKKHGINVDMVGEEAADLVKQVRRQKDTEVSEEFTVVKDLAV